MADFRTHIMTSTTIGIGYGALGVLSFDMSLEQGVLAAGLCGIAGIFPDLDSDSGIPVRETIALTAAVVPLLMLERLRDLGLDRESIVVCGILIYVSIRFGVASIFKRYTVHRGMWHSVPAAGIAGLLAYLLTAYDEMPVRLFKTFAVILGFMVHLILDELWSIDFTHGLPRVKKSFGTAIKFYDERGLWPNVSTYGKLLLLAFIAFGDPTWMEQLKGQREEIQRTARDHLQDWIQKVKQTDHTQVLR